MAAERDRERIIFGADNEDGLVAVRLDRVLGLIGRGETRAALFVGDRIARLNETVAAGAERASIARTSFFATAAASAATAASGEA